MFRSFFTPPRPERSNQTYRDEGNKMLRAAGSALWNSIVYQTREVIKEVPFEKIVYVDREVIKHVPVERIVEVEKVVYRTRSTLENTAPALMTGSPTGSASPALSMNMSDMTDRVNAMRNQLAGATRLSSTPLVGKEEDIDLTLSAKAAQLKAVELTNSRKADKSSPNPLAHTMPSPMLNTLCNEINEERPQPTEEQIKQIKAMSKHAAKVAGVNFYDNLGSNPNSENPVPRTPGTPKLGAFRNRVSRPDLTSEQLAVPPSPRLGRNTRSIELPPIGTSPTLPSPTLTGRERSGSMTERLAAEAKISPNSPNIVGR